MFGGFCNYCQETIQLITKTLIFCFMYMLLIINKKYKEEKKLKKNIKKLLPLMIIMVLTVFMLTACGDKTEGSGNDNVTDAPKDGDTKDTDTPDPTATEGPVVDLGGIDIIVGDWWTSAEPGEPKNQQEEDTLAYHNSIQEKYKFTLQQVGITDWGGMQELFTVSVMANDPAADIFLLGQDWTAQPLANGLLYDLATLDSFDFTESKWNQSTINLMKYGESVYGMSTGMAEPKLGLFWNKRLFEEASLDRDLPYDLQDSGNWTWDEFEKLCQKLTRDTNSDGTIDTYAMVSFSVDFFKAAMTGYEARYIGRDDAGKFFNATAEPQFLEALQRAVGLIEDGYEMPAPPDSNWDWFVPAFHDAKVAMQFGEQYKVGQWADMTDDWGFVLVPKVNAADPYHVYFNDNVVVMPSTFDAETAEKIAFAYNLWTNPTPGYEDVTDVWKENYYPNFRDDRAVDETLAMMYKPETVVVNEFQPFVYGTNTGDDFIWNVYGLNSTPAEKREELFTKWEALINDANK